MESAKKIVRKKMQQSFIESLKEAPMLTGLLIRKNDGFGMVSTHNGLVHAKIPEQDANGNDIKCEVGYRVKILAETGVIVGSIPQGSPLEVLSGKVGTVRQVAGDICEVETDGGVIASLLNGKRPEKGDRVIVDDSCVLVLHNLGKTEETYKAEKSLLGKAVATSLASLYGKEVNTGFIYVKGPEILNKWVGESEATVRSFFNRARDHQKKNGYPAVIFIDEADAILMSRGGHGRHLSGMEDTIVPMFLSEMDGMEQSAAFVILATNRPDMLDRAIVREGRIDRRVEI